jgi:hypothetical protein
MFTPNFARSPGDDHRRATLREASTADLEVCARLFCAAIRRNLPKTMTRDRLVALLASPGARGFLWLDERCTPVGFTIGRCRDGCFEVLELCAPAERAGLELLSAVRCAVSAHDVIFSAELSRGRARRLVEAL